MTPLLLMPLSILLTAVSCQHTRRNNDLSTDQRKPFLQDIGVSQESFIQMQRKLDALNDQLHQVRRLNEDLAKLTVNLFQPQLVHDRSIASIHRLLIGQITYPSLSHIIPGVQAVNALTSFNDQLYVTRRGSSQISVYNTSTGELERTIPVPGSTDWQCGLVPCPSKNCLLMTDFHNNKVHKITLAQSQRSDAVTTTSWPVAYHPLGLSVNRMNNLLVASEAKKIQEYTLNGLLVREMPDSYMLYHAVEQFNGIFAVSRLVPGLFSVCLMSYNGTVRRCSRSMASVSGNNFGQRGLTVDSHGFVYVADMTNNRIVVLDPNLVEARTLLLPTHGLEELNLPRAIWLDESNGRLYVGEEGRPYRVLVFDNVFNLNL